MQHTKLMKKSDTNNVGQSDKISNVDCYKSKLTGMHVYCLISMLMHTLKLGHKHICQLHTSKFFPHSQLQ